MSEAITGHRPLTQGSMTVSKTPAKSKCKTIELSHIRAMCAGTEHFGQASEQELRELHAAFIAMERGIT